MAFPLTPADPEGLGLDPGALAPLCDAVDQDIATGKHPGAQIAVARRGRLGLFRSVGQARVGEDARTADDRTLWLLYSNTEVVTAATVWRLVEDGALRFADPIAAHLP